MIKLFCLLMLLSGLVHADSIRCNAQINTNCSRPLPAEDWPENNNDGSVVSKLEVQKTLYEIIEVTDGLPELGTTASYRAYVTLPKDYVSVSVLSARPDMFNGKPKSSSPSFAFVESYDRTTRTAMVRFTRTYRWWGSNSGRDPVSGTETDSFFKYSNIKLLGILEK